MNVCLLAWAVWFGTFTCFNSASKLSLNISRKLTFEYTRISSSFLFMCTFFIVVEVVAALVLDY